MQDVALVNLHAAQGVALREFPLNPGHGTADYMLHVNGRACGVIEAKKQGATLTGVEAQSGRYAQGLPASLPAWTRPLPFLYESTGIETHFTSGLDPAPRGTQRLCFSSPRHAVRMAARLASGRADALRRHGGAHRGVVIERYADRFELSNPGSLLVSREREQLLRGGVSECRNKSL